MPSTAQWTVGPALSPDTFFLAKQVPLGAGRYATTTYIGAGVQFPTVAFGSPLGQALGYLLAPYIFDTQATADNKTCSPFKLEDGQYHCLVGAVHEGFFLDPACTQPAADEYAAYVSYQVKPDIYDQACAFDAPSRLFVAGALIASGQSVKAYQVLPATGLCAETSPRRLREIVGALDPSVVPAMPVAQD